MTPRAGGTSTSRSRSRSRSRSPRPRGTSTFRSASRRLPAGTTVESYSAEVLKRARPVIEQTRQAPATTATMRAPIGSVVKRRRVRIPAGQVGRPDAGGSRSTAAPGAITALMCKVEAADLDDALARTLLTITFDGAEQPQVAVPLGDFFGSGPGSTRSSRELNRVRSRRLDGGAAGTCPSASPCRIRLTNFTKQPVTVSAGVSMRPRPGPARVLSTSTPAGDTRTSFRPRRPTAPWTGPRCGSRDRLAALSACS